VYLLITCRVLRTTASDPGGTGWEAVKIGGWVRLLGWRVGSETQGWWVLSDPVVLVRCVSATHNLGWRA
jgi:hypothetical protein